MTSLQISDSDIPRLDGKVCIVTGGSSGIGLATTRLLADRGGRVHVLDIHPPIDQVPDTVTFHQCDQSSWPDLNQAFSTIGSVDIAIANAGVSEASDFSKDTWMSSSSDNNKNDSSSSSDTLEEPNFRVIDVNLRGTISLVKLATAWMRRQGRARGGSIVLTSSATAYAPEQSLPVYAATKHALVGFMRAQRSTLPAHNISINCVAPAATESALLPLELATPLRAAGLPVSSAEFVARAVVFSATARQESSVEEYGKDVPGSGKGRWNGRCILTLGETYTELERGLVEAKGVWFGQENLRLTRLQQAATDFRLPVENGQAPT